ncbi:MAG TPA: energy transducer TonB [Blastocatellia bacterium]|nr:energy transducer TonB [Blastocatellia bacterium]
MFNKLVVSTNERRRGRIARFFFGTSAIYAMVIAGVLGLSVMVSTPRLADTGERMLALLAPPPPGPPPPPQHDSTPPPVAPRNDPTQVRDLDQVINTPPPVRRHDAPPSIDNVAGVWGAPDSIGPPDGIGNVPGSPSHSETPAPPPPPRTAEPPRPAPQVDTTHPVRVSTGVLQGKAIVKRTPEYPPLARQIHLAGSVSVELMIAPDGHVEAARAINGHPLLVTAAVEAARAWRFEPTLLNGTAVRVTGVIVFNFTMQ